MSPAMIEHELHAPYRYVESEETIRNAQSFLVIDPPGTEPISILLHAVYDQRATEMESEIESQFRRLSDEWREQTRFQSSGTVIVSNPAYLRIIALGRTVVPLILRDLEIRPDHWFWALHILTGENPAPPETQGNLRAMTAAWLDWGRQRGLLR